MGAWRADFLLSLEHEHDARTAAHGLQCVQAQKQRPEVVRDAARVDSPIEFGRPPGIGVPAVVRCLHVVVPGAPDPDFPARAPRYEHGFALGRSLGLDVESEPLKSRLEVAECVVKACTAICERRHGKK